jgi:hypothetical protein
MHRLRRQVASLVRRRVSQRGWAAVESVVNPADALVASAHDAVMRNVRHGAVSLLERVRRSHSLPWNMHTLFGLSGLQHDAVGQHDFSWLGTYDYVRNELGLRSETEPLLGLWQVATSVGWMQPHERTCWLVERPYVLCGDATIDCTTRKARANDGVLCRSRLRSKVIDFRCIAPACASLASAPAACSTSRRSTSNPATGSRSGRRLPAPALPRPGPTIGCASRLWPPNASRSASCRRAGSPNEPKWQPRSLTRLRCLFRRPEFGYARYRSRFLSRQRAMREGPERARRASASAGPSPRAACRP